MRRSIGSRLVLAWIVVALLASPTLAATVVRVSGWGGTDIAIVEELISRFVKPVVEKEGIEVKYEPIAEDFAGFLTNSLSAGTAPDLFYMDIFWAEPLIAAGRIEPLDDYLARSKVLHKQDILPNLLQAFTYKGKVYGIPKDFNTLALFYNKDLFDDAGVAYPNETDTWDTLVAKLRKLSRPQEGIYGVAATPEFARFGAFAYAAGFKLFDEKGRSDLSQPGFVEAFRWYTGLVRDKVGVLPADLGQGWGGGALATEKVGAAFEGAWILGFLRDQAPNLRYGATLLPKHPTTKQRGNFIYTVSWSINAASKVKQAAFKVLEALTSPEAQQWVLRRGLALPSRAALLNDPYFQQKSPEAEANLIVFRGASDGNVQPFKFGKYGDAWMRPVNEALSGVMTGELTVEKALQQAQKALDEVTSR
ncbi:ABC transporter substrate-binding protein [Carboxydochorda subterranea]|uniref:ABC transporter substrate-binding protein n=1 Tax=Carboxydichorda subterranea TaxID=3109565 RepID=A0ABZ1BU50_9FIRM|nr:ABC transporter substrate-binding protein [Limnochorda sp. L945t]WRP16331.1 ABC transporter substrate-binding protein [Limnochorda sp. L945t]